MGAVERLPVRRLTKPELAVFVSGVTSMGLQILALRVVVPQFGSHIYTTGGVITVFLAALALGYWRGGKRASGHASNQRLIWVLLLTAVYVAFLIFTRDLLLVATAAIPMPSRYASLPAIVLLFGPPTYLLGFISPYAAELSHKEATGEASGDVYAFGTAGSILGTAATTFVLVPATSIEGIGLFFGLLLIATALVLTLPDPAPRPVVSSLAVAALVVLATVGSGAAAVDVRGDVVYQTQTAYQQLEVIDRGDTRTLYLDGARHSAMDLEEPDRHVFAYTRYFHLPYLFADDPDDVERVLFVGGGGFTGPKSFLERDDDVEVDVVELDPEVTSTAKTYFDVEESDRLTIHTGDGRQFLAETDETYDVIVLDAYRQDKVPFELTTVEFMHLAESRLSDDGVLLANVISAPEGPASAFFRSQHATMDEAFPQVYAFRTSDSSAIQNLEVVATKDDDRLTRAELHERDDAREIGIDLSAEVDYYVEDVDTGGAPVLEDDRAPVDSLLDPMMGQRYVVEETDDGSAADGDEPTESPAIVARVDGGGGAITAAG